MTHDKNLDFLFAFKVFCFNTNYKVARDSEESCARPKRLETQMDKSIYLYFLGERKVFNLSLAKGKKKVITGDFI